MRKSLAISSFVAALLGTQIASAVTVQCTYEHSETMFYSEKTQRLTVVDPHTADPKVEIFIFSEVILASNGIRGSDGRLNSLELRDKNSKVLLTVTRGAVENNETGEFSTHKGIWDIGFVRIVGGCTVSK